MDVYEEAPARWRPGYVPRPALSRRDVLRRQPASHPSDGKRAYLEAYDLLTAFPGHLEAIYAGLIDAALLREQVA